MLQGFRVVSKRTKNKNCCDLSSILLNADSDLVDISDVFANSRTTC